MEFAITHKLAKYLEKRVAFRKAASLLASDDEMIRSELYYCASFGLAKLSSGKWRVTKQLMREPANFRYRCHWDSDDDDIAVRRDRAAMSCSLEYAIEKYISCARRAKFDIGVSPTVASVLELWIGEGLCEYYEGSNWIISHKFFGLQMHELPKLPEFRRWAFEQLNKPRVCDELKKAMHEDIPQWLRKPDVNDVLYDYVAAGMAEPFLDNKNRLHWRATKLLGASAHNT